MALLVRSWNVFHGNTDPPGRRNRLEDMVRLISPGAAVVCLQEVPLWALPRLAAWSGMRPFPAVTRHSLGPPGLTGRLTRLHSGLFRSAIAGQANVTLVAPEHDATALGAVRVSEPGRERRICHAVRVGAFAVGNVHASNEFGDPSVARAELERAWKLLERFGDPLVLAGDFNLRDPDLPGPEIDHIVVRGAPYSPLDVWPKERRRQNGAVLSDHAPVELVAG